MTTSWIRSRSAIVDHLRAVVARGEAIIGGGAGTGISAKSEEAGGIDLLIVYNSGRYRMAGRGSVSGMMPYGNANQIVKEMAFEILPVVKRTPVLAGVCGTDPFMIPRLLLSELRELGYAGVQNFPTVGLIDGDFRAVLEETGMSYGLEVDMIALAHELDFLTTPYAFNPDEGVAMTRAGADIVVAHMGCTSGGTIGARSVKTLDSCIVEVQAIIDACRRERRDILCLCHGGPISSPSDARYVIDRVDGLHGFYGASSTERLPTEIAIRAQIEEFKKIRLPRAAAAAAKSTRKSAAKSAAKSTPKSTPKSPRSPSARKKR